MPVATRAARRSTASRSRRARSRADSGSSSRSSRGAGARARARATRCRSPPDRVATPRGLVAGQPDELEQLRRRARADRRAAARTRRSRRRSGAGTAGRPGTSARTRAGARARRRRRRRPTRPCRRRAARAPRRRAAATTSRSRTARAARRPRPSATSRDTPSTAATGPYRTTSPAGSDRSPPLTSRAGRAQPFAECHDPRREQREHHGRGERHAVGPGPGRPISRKITTGSVGLSGRARKDVAPNSPSETANANPIARPRDRAAIGRSTVRSTRPGAAPSVAAASRSRGSIARSTGSTVRTTRGTATTACAIGTSSRAGPQVDRQPERVVHRQQEPEPDGHRGHPEREHEHARRAPTTARRPTARRGRRDTTSATSPPTTSAITVASTAIRSEFSVACHTVTRQRAPPVVPSAA